MWRILGIVLLIAVIGAPAALYFMSSTTGVELTPAVKAVGKETAFTIRTDNPHGVRRVALEVRQGTVAAQAEVGYPASRVWFWRAHKAPENHTLKLQTNAPAGFHSGAAKLRVTATANDFRGKETVLESDVVVNLEPPSIHADEEGEDGSNMVESDSINAHGAAVGTGIADSEAESTG